MALFARQVACHAHTFKVSRGIYDGKCADLLGRLKHAFTLHFSLAVRVIIGWALP